MISTKINTMKYVELDELLKKSDVICLHCPLFENTKGIINKDTISRMKDGVKILNNSRGPLVVEKDLAEALNSGKVGAAAVDIVSTEPIKEDNPLLKAKNCIITSHISWAPKESRVRLMNIAIDNLKQFLSGKPVNVVNNKGMVIMKENLIILLAPDSFKESMTAKEVCEAMYGILGDGETGILEMASASGLHLVPPEKRNPLITTTYDGGAGVFQALGGKLLDNAGNELGYGGGELGKLAAIDLTNYDMRLKEIVVEVACDVTNPLCGEKGKENIEKTSENIIRLLSLM